MSVEHYHQFFPTVLTGFGLTLVGGANLLLLHRSVLCRATATVLALTVVVSGACAINLSGVVAGTVGLLACALVPVLLLSNARVVARVGAVCGKVTSPATRFTIVTVAGVGIVVGSTIVFQTIDDAVNQESFKDLTALEAPCNSVECGHTKAATDRGRAIVLKEPAVIRHITVHEVNETRVLAAQRPTRGAARRRCGGDT